MPLIDADFFYTRRSQTQSDIPSTMVTNHLFDAETLLRDMTGTTQYDDAAAIKEKAENERTTDETRKLESFKRAEADLLMESLLLDLTIPINDQGIVMEAHSQNFGPGTFRIASQREREGLALGFRTKARRLIKDYLPDTTGTLPECAGG